MISADNLLKNNDENPVDFELNEGFADFKKWLGRLFSKYEIPGGTDSPAYKSFEKFVTDLRSKGWDDKDVLEFLKGTIKKVPSGSGTTQGSEADEERRDSGVVDRDQEDDDDQRFVGKETQRRGSGTREPNDDLESEDDDTLDDLEGDVQDAVFGALKARYTGAPKKKLLGVSSKISKKFVEKFGGKLKRAVRGRAIREFLEDDFPKLIKPRKEIATAIGKIVRDYLGIEDKPVSKQKEPTKAEPVKSSDKGTEASATASSSTTEGVFKYNGVVLGETAKERYRNYLALLEGEDSLSEGFWSRLGTKLSGGSYNIAGLEKDENYRGMLEFISDLKAEHDDGDVLEFFKVMLKRLPKVSGIKSTEKKTAQKVSDDSSKPDKENSKALPAKGQSTITDKTKNKLKRQLAAAGHSDKPEGLPSNVQGKINSLIDSGKIDDAKKLASEHGITLQERWLRLADLL